MPNYSLTVDSKFEPFSFERYISPYKIYGDAYKEQEKALEELATTSDALAGLINPLVDKETYSEYSDYNKALDNLANELSTKGLNIQSRRAGKDLRRQYGRNFSNIKDLYERRRTLADSQLNLKTKDDSIRFDRDMSTVTLDEMRKNPEINYSALSGDTIAKRTSDMAQAISKAIVEDPEYDSMLGSQYFQERIQQGATIEDVLNEMDSHRLAEVIQQKVGDNATAEQIQEVYDEMMQKLEPLRKIRQTIHDEIESNPAYNKDWTDSYINRGIYDAIGTAKYNLVQNRNYITTMEQRMFDAQYEEGPDGRWRKRPSVENLIPISGTDHFYDPITRTERDKDGNVIKNEDGKIVIGSGSGSGDSKKPPLFADFYQNSRKFVTLNENSYNDLNYNDLKHIDVKDISPAAVVKLKKDLEEGHDLEISDVDIYRDPDIFLSPDEFIVVPKQRSPFDPSRYLDDTEAEKVGYKGETKVKEEARKRAEEAAGF